MLIIVIVVFLFCMKIFFFCFSPRYVFLFLIYCSLAYHTHTHNLMLFQTVHFYFVSYVCVCVCVLRVCSFTALLQNSKTKTTHHQPIHFQCWQIALHAFRLLTNKCCVRITQCLLQFKVHFWFLYAFSLVFFYILAEFCYLFKFFFCCVLWFPFYALKRKKGQINAFAMQK